MVSPLFYYSRRTRTDRNTGPDTWCISLLKHGDDNLGSYSLLLLSQLYIKFLFFVKFLLAFNKVASCPNSGISCRLKTARWLSPFSDFLQQFKDPLWCATCQHCPLLSRSDAKDLQLCCPASITCPLCCNFFAVEVTSFLVGASAATETLVVTWLSRIGW